MPTVVAPEHFQTQQRLVPSLAPKLSWSFEPALGLPTGGFHGTPANGFSGPPPGPVIHAVLMFLAAGHFFGHRLGRGSTRPPGRRPDPFPRARPGRVPLGAPPDPAWREVVSPPSGVPTSAGLLHRPFAGQKRGHFLHRRRIFARHHWLGCLLRRDGASGEALAANDPSRRLQSGCAEQSIWFQHQLGQRPKRLEWKPAPIWPIPFELRS
jgi:hypothetical protein